MELQNEPISRSFILRILISFLFLYSSFFVEGQSLLKLLENEENSGFSLKKKLKQDLSSVFPDSLKVRSVDIDSFVTAFENKDFKTSLKIWNQNIRETDFSKSSTGVALYNYLLVKNDFEFLGFYSLLSSSQPKDIHPIVRQLWKRQTETDLWKFFSFPIEADWQLVFQPESIIQANRNHSFDLEKDHEHMKSLLALPLDEDFENFDLEWSFLLSLLKKGEKESVVKLLSWFLSKKPAQKNKINLTIARLLADIGEYEVALSYYKKLEGLSYQTLMAREEMSWIFLNEKTNQKGIPQAKEYSLVFSYPGLNLNPSMFFVLALSQFKNCDYQGAFQTLKSFQGFFSKDSLKTFFDKKDFDALSLGLLKYYRSELPLLAINTPVWPYSIRADKKLRKQIFLYDYLSKSHLKKQVFKKEFLREKALIQKLKKARDERFFVLLKKEYHERALFLKYFQILEAEMLYQHYGKKPVLFQTVKPSFKKINPSELFFPFERDELWLDELFDYQVNKNKWCPLSKPLIKQ